MVRLPHITIYKYSIWQWPLTCPVTTACLSTSARLGSRKQNDCRLSHLQHQASVCTKCTTPQSLLSKEQNRKQRGGTPSLLLLSLSLLHSFQVWIIGLWIPSWKGLLRFLNPGVSTLGLTWLVCVCVSVIVWEAQRRPVMASEDLSDDLLVDQRTDSPATTDDAESPVTARAGLVAANPLCVM